MKAHTRREFFKNTLLFGGAIALLPEKISLGQMTPPATSDGELTPAPLRPLPLGTVRAERWLEHQLWLQAKGITGAMEDYPSYNASSAWLGGDGEDWEKGPYYVRGLVALAYVLNDTGLKKKAQKWIDWSLENQRDDGSFGPRKNNSWWSRMPMLAAIRDYYEASGKNDTRVLPFLEKYFRHQLSELPKRHLSNWADERGADNIDSVLWYYCEIIQNGTDAREAAWLLDLARLLKQQTHRWSDDFTDTTARFHIVNTTQALKFPPVVYRFTKDEKDRRAFENGIFNYSVDHGRIDGLPNSDEAARDNSSTRGTESCAVVEALLSTEIALRDFGDATLGDYLEHVAYNALPLMNSPDFSGHCYYALQNSVMCTHGYHGFDCDHGDDTAFGAPGGFECCFPNHHMGWAKFIQHTWMANADGGLTLIAYAPNRVRAAVSGGKMTAFRQETDYPFDGAITLFYAGETAEFPLDLRIPAWAGGAIISVNGQNLSGAIAGEFFRVRRVFKDGDVVKIKFPDDKILTSRWFNDTVAVRRGPLLYALKIAEDWRVTHGNDTRQTKLAATDEQPLREVFPASRWNYGLVVDEKNPAVSFQVSRREIPPQPFSTNAAPIVLKARGQIIPEWILENNATAPQPLGAVPFDAKKIEAVELIPYACGRLKIAHFPRIGDPGDFMRRDLFTAKKFMRRGGRILEFDNVIVSPAGDYTLQVFANGTGSVSLEINGKKIGEIDLKNGTAEQKNLRGLIAGEALKFKEKQYNNIRFSGNDTDKISGIEIVPSEKFSEPKILGIEGGATHVMLRTNVPRDIATYRVFYGTRGKNYTHSARGFENENALLTGLKPDTTHYFTIEARIGGILKRSAEVSFKTEKNDTARETGARAAPEITAESAFEVVQIKYKKAGDADFYKVEFGTKSGEYTQAQYGIRYHVWNYEADKVSVAGLKNDTDYFLRLVPLNGTAEMTPSNEIKIRTNFRSTPIKSRLADAVRDAEKISPRGSDVAKKEFSDAVAFAKKVLANDTANQIEVEVARKNLVVAGAKI